MAKPDIAALACEIESLKTRVARLEGAHTPTASVAREEDGVRVIRGAELDGRRFPMPASSELRQLLAIVVGRYPQLGPDAIYRDHGHAHERRRLEYFEEFVSAFRFVGDMTRAESLDLKRAASWWVDEGEQWFRVRGEPRTLRLPAFTAAVIAHGDVLFASLLTFPYDVAFGLRTDGIGRPVSDRWRHVLATGQLRDPIETTASKTRYAPQPSVTLR